MTERPLPLSRVSVSSAGRPQGGLESSLKLKKERSIHFPTLVLVSLSSMTSVILKGSNQEEFLASRGRENLMMQS